MTHNTPYLYTDKYSCIEARLPTIKINRIFAAADFERFIIDAMQAEGKLADIIGKGSNTTNKARIKTTNNQKV